MNENTSINQKQGIGNQGTQIGVQNVYGISVIEATQMAFAIFREYYPQLREEALSELKTLVETKLNNIPGYCITPPSPRIAVPTLQYASITEEYEIRELYANLLANSMNKVVKNGVHPGFVEIIKQLSPDEAKILQYMKNHSSVPTISLKYCHNEGGGIEIINNFSIVGEQAGCEIPHNTHNYFDNLVRLGLLDDAKGLSFLTDKTLYEPLKKHILVSNKATNDKAKALGFDKYEFVESYIKLTSYGRSFCDICLTP